MSEPTKKEIMHSPTQSAASGEKDIMNTKPCEKDVLTPGITPGLSHKMDSEPEMQIASRPGPPRQPSRNLPPYLYRALEASQSSKSRRDPSPNASPEDAQRSSMTSTEKGSAMSPSPRTETQSAPPTQQPSFSRRSTALPAYYDSEPSSQPPKYFNPDKPFSPALPIISRNPSSVSTPKPYAPASASAVNAVIAQPSAQWAEHDKKKRGFRGWLKDWKADFGRDPDRDDPGAGPRHDRGSQPVANVWGVRVSGIKASERGKSSRSWR